MGRTDRRRARDPARRADAAGVLHGRRRPRGSTRSFHSRVCSLLTPVLHPPAIRVFDDQRYFCFANPAAILGPAPTSSTVAGARTRLACAPSATGCRHRGRGGDRQGSRSPRTGADPELPAAEGSRLRARARPSRRHAGRARSGRAGGDRQGRRGGASAGSLRGLRLGSARERMQPTGRRCAPGDLLAGPALERRRDGLEPGSAVELEVGRHRRSRVRPSAAMKSRRRLGRNRHGDRRAPPRAARVRRREDLRRCREPARARPDAARGDRARVRERSGAARRGRRVDAGERPHPGRVRTSSRARIAR